MSVPFDEPWQARLFALTEAMIEAGELDRETFRQRLIACVEEAPALPYWESWLAALESMAEERGLVLTGTPERPSP